MKTEAQQALQATFDLFYGSGGISPTLGDLQRELNRRYGRNVDATRIVRRIPATLLKPLRYTDGYPEPTERLVLTVEGIARCAGSDEDVKNFVAAVQWLARRAVRSNSGEHGVRYTTRQLAGAVSLSMESDYEAINRLVAILQAEGWAQDGSNTQSKPWTRLRRALENLALLWHRAALGLS